ncbi:conjugative transposon protein TraM [Myroides sp. LJL110]
MAKSVVRQKKKQKYLPGLKHPSKTRDLKKFIVYTLLALLFLLSQWLIFKPAKKEFIISGDVPEASSLQMQNDKIKVYETSLWENKNSNQDGLLQSLEITLDSTNGTLQEIPLPQVALDEDENSLKQAMLNYAKTRTLVDDFYKQETIFSQPSEFNLPKPSTPSFSHSEPLVNSSSLEDQLEFVEKSFEIASRYLPKDSNLPAVNLPSSNLNFGENSKVEVTPLKVDVVSKLERKLPIGISDVTDSVAFTTNGFYSVEDLNQPKKLMKNALLVYIKENQTLVNKGSVKLGVLQDVRINGRILTKETTLHAVAVVQNDRLQLYIDSIILEGVLTNVDFTGYDLTGQRGLEVFNVKNVSVGKEILGNMGQSAQTSISILNPLKDQIATDLTRSALNGVSGYFSKKQRTVRVKLKKGQELYLMAQVK